MRLDQHHKEWEPGLVLVAGHQAEQPADRKAETSHRGLTEYVETRKGCGGGYRDGPTRR